MSAGARQVLYLAVAVAFLAQPALADEAKRRDGGSSSSSAGSRHHSGSSGSSSVSSRSSGSSHASGSSSRAALSGAERRHPRAGTGTGSHYPYGYYSRGHRGYYGGYYGGYWGGYPYHRYRPYYSWGFGYYPYSGLYLDSWWWSAPYHGHGVYVRSSSDTGSVRMLVDQPKARVYVDGYLAGIVDDYDGMFQRLYVEPGEHDITLKLEGYKTHTFSAYVPYEGTLKLRWEMEPGEGHDGSGDPTLAPPRRAARDERRSRYAAEDDRDDDRDDDRERGRDAYRDRDADRERANDRDAERSVEQAPRREEPVGLGSVRFEVRPSDASIYVDGAFRGTGRDLRSLELKAGSHRVEIVKPGYRTYERDVVVDAAAFLDLSVELEK